MSWGRLADYRADEERGWSGREAAVVIEQGGTVQAGAESELGQLAILRGYMEAASATAVDQLQIGELANRLDYLDAAMLEFSCGQALTARTAAELSGRPAICAS